MTLLDLPRHTANVMMSNNYRTYLFLLLVFLVALDTSANDLRTVALSNQSAAGGPASSRYGTLGRFYGIVDPSINSAGNVAFHGSMSQFFGGVTSEDNSGLWSEGGGSLDLLVREGDQAPGASNGVVFDFFDDDLILNDQGRVAFVAALKTNIGMQQAALIQAFGQKVVDL